MLTMLEADELFLQKAVESLDGATSEFVNNRYNNCANVVTMLASRPLSTPWSVLVLSRLGEVISGAMTLSKPNLMAN
jgi:hypothetical protein